MTARIYLLSQRKTLDQRVINNRDELGEEKAAVQRKGIEREAAMRNRDLAQG
jgi:hypothetical protein